MNVHLMHRESDFDPTRALPANAETLSEDLDLQRLLGAMAAGDRYLYEVARAAVFSPLGDPDEIRYRQDVLRDCLEREAVLRELYAAAVDGVEVQKKVFFGFGRSNNPEATLHGAASLLQLLRENLVQLRKIGDEHAEEFTSAGFQTFFSMIERELDDDYLARVKEHLSVLAGSTVWASARLGRGANGVDYVLHRRPERGLMERLAAVTSRSVYTYRVPDRDEAGARALGELRGRALNEVANTAAQSAEHVRGFFRQLRAELGFYLSACNLHGYLAAKEQPTCFPIPLPMSERTLLATGLYEPCLALRAQGRVVGSDVRGEGRALIVITGANQGGKSTFLRSAGIAQLMLQCGMFVAADSLSANVCEAVFTHFKREEDTTMQSGKLDEEMARMSEIADQAGPHSLLLFNESFAATNEREGSEIARQIIRALLDSESKVLFVTHMYDLASRLRKDDTGHALFLRAERLDDGTRTFRLIEGDPLSTSYGPDVYAKVFGDNADSDQEDTNAPPSPTIDLQVADGSTA